MLHPWWPLPPGPAFSRPSVINTFPKVDQPPPWPCVAARWLVVGWRSSWTLRMSWSSVSSVPSRRSLVKGSNVGSWGRGVERGKYIRWKKTIQYCWVPIFYTSIGNVEYQSVDIRLDILLENIPKPDTVWGINLLAFPILSMKHREKLGRHCGLWTLLKWCPLFGGIYRRYSQLGTRWCPPFILTPWHTDISTKLNSDTIVINQLCQLFSLLRYIII